MTLEPEEVPLKSIPVEVTPSTKKSSPHANHAAFSGPPLDVVIVDPSPLKVDSKMKESKSVSPPPVVMRRNFRLQPRGRVFDASDSSVRSSRGRKRSAWCLNQTSFTADVFETRTQDASSPLHSLRGVVASDACAKEFKETITNEESNLLYPMNILSTPKSVENAMQCLSLKSPKNSMYQSPKGDLSPASSSSMVQNHAQESPFVAYGSSPFGSSFARPRSNSSASSASSSKKSCFSPSHSSLSSPRLAPLIVIQRNGTDMNDRTSPNRPPLHGGPVTMMHSIDCRKSPIPKSQDSPLTPPHCPRQKDVLSSLLEVAVASPRTPGTAASARSSTSYGSHPSGISYKSPYATPLPTVRLTPKRTPRRTQLSPDVSGSPMSDLGLLPLDLSTKFNLNAKVKENPACGKHPAPQRSPTSYLPLPDWGNGPLLCSPQQPPNSNLPMFASPCSAREEASKNTLAHPPRSSTSLLSPPARSIAEVLSNHSQSMVCDESLTDDEDAGFVLMDPCTLGQETRPNQRARRSGPSSTSLASSTHASDASLLGMSFLNGDSCSSLKRMEGSVGGSLSAWGKRRSSENMLSRMGSHRTLRSEEDFTSIGLELDNNIVEEQEEGNRRRDVVTPPAILPQRSLSPPPMQRNPIYHGFSMTPPTAPASSLAHMSFESPHQAQSPSVECPS